MATQLGGDLRELMGQMDHLTSEHQVIVKALFEAKQPQYPARFALQKAYNRVGANNPDQLPRDEKKTGGFKSFGHFAQSVFESTVRPGGWQAHPQMNKYVTKILPSGLGETGAADGGFLVPPEFANTLLQRVYDNDLMSRTTLFPMTSNQLKIPAVAETSRADGSRFGGVQGYWRGEAGTITESKPNFAQISLQLNSLTIAVRITQELLEDSGVALETYMDTVANQELQFKIGDAIVNGTGNEMPKGLMNSPSKITLADPGSLAGSINSAQVMAMWARLHLSCRKGAVWLIDQSLEPALFSMTIGTSSWPVYLPPGGLSGSPYATLLGAPVIITEFGKQAGTEGDILLTDLSTYLTGNKGGIQSGISVHLYWLSNESSFKFTMRMDGQNWWMSALTPKSGGSTQSNVITQATRS